MLQAPSHFSRVCGHGHIKKFWLMQTQKESQACESKSSVLFSSPSPSRPVNRGTVKGLESSPWSSSSPVSHSPGYGETVATPPKHSSFTCAESLSPPSHLFKAGPSHSPHSTGSTGTLADKDSNFTRSDGVDSYNRILEHDAHPSTPSPRSYSVNVASELERKNYHGPATAALEADLVEPVPLVGCYSREDALSTSTEGSPNFHSSHLHPVRVQQEKTTSPATQNTSCTHSPNMEDRSSPAHSSKDARDVKSSSNHARSSTPATMGLEGMPERSRTNSGAMFANRTHDHMDRDRLPQASYVQHAALKACTLCGTTKTPMWRSGPQGPKSLCNACGIRFKKYRSFPGQSESPELMVTPHMGPMGSKSLSRPLKRKQTAVLPPCEPSRPQKMCFKASVSDVGSQQPKKSKWHQLVVKREQSELKELNRESSSPWNTQAGPASFKKIYGCAPFQSKFKKLAPMDEHRRVFAKDEEEAAVLLMHLSCGLVY